MGFTSFGLSDLIVQGVRAAGFTAPTPIQYLAIGPALAGKDIIGCAQTGTGKTAAFVLPILQRLSTEAAPHRRNRHPRALVLTPTRELAQQVQAAVSTYGRFLQLRAVSIYGGASIHGQFKLLSRGADVIIATPGRLLDHMERGTIDLSAIQVLVLDEADRMLDMGFINDVKKIVGAVSKGRQTMLFSATLSDEIKELAAHILRDPETVRVGEQRNPVDAIVQHFYGAPHDAKLHLLLHALESERMESVLVFSRTKHGADKICRRLDRSGIPAAAIHSNRSQVQREKALEGFKRGHHRVLVATDIAARGIDVTGISHVINYDIPQCGEDYIHRIGRTGRAGATGQAITFVARDERQHLRTIERFTGKRLSLRDYPGFTPPQREPVASTTPAKNPMPQGERPHHSGQRGSAQFPAKHRGQPKKQFGRKKRAFEPPRKKKPVRKLESFSSDTSWTNY